MEGIAKNIENILNFICDKLITNLRCFGFFFFKKMIFVGKCR